MRAHSCDLLYYASTTQIVCLAYAKEIEGSSQEIHYILYLLYVVRRLFLSAQVLVVLGDRVSIPSKLRDFSRRHHVRTHLANPAVSN